MPENDEVRDDEQDERPRPPDDDEDDEEEDVDAREAGGIGTSAPWTPTPTWPARQFLQAVPSAKFDVQFPQVFDEDRSAKITDLATARAESVISHRRMAEQVAKELGVEEYDYNAEQAQIAKEEPAQPRMTGSDPGAPGMGDALVPSTVVPPEPPSRNGPVPATTHDETMPRGRRADLSGDATVEFKKQMRQAEESVRAIGAELVRLREGATRDAFAQTLDAFEKLTRALTDVLAQQRPLMEAAAKPAPAPVIHVDAPRVEVKPADVHVEVPAMPTPEVISIMTPPPERRIVDKRVDYDAQGLATRVIEVDDQGRERVSRVKRSDDGRIIGLELESSGQ